MRSRCRHSPLASKARRSRRRPRPRSDGHDFLLAVERRYPEALDHAMAILQRDREFREDAGRLTMIRIMALMGRGSEIAKRYRRRMFNFLH